MHYINRYVIRGYYWVGLLGRVLLLSRDLGRGYYFGRVIN